jgi:hypothetical protein
MSTMATEKYGSLSLETTGFDREIAELLFSQLEDLLLNTGNFETETTLEVDDHTEFEYFDGDNADSSSSPENSQGSNSTGSSQEWGILKIGGEEFTIDQMKNIVEFYDNKKSKKFERTQQRYPRVSDSKCISRFREYLASNGTRVSKLTDLEAYVSAKFHTARDQFLAVHDRDIRRWAIQKSKEIDLEFLASNTWLWLFKQRNRIVARKITKYITQKDIAGFETLQQVANDFVHSAKLEFIGVESSKIFNTDQSGFNYELAANRTLSNRGEKSTLALVKSVSATTHSYSIMPLISMDGRLRGRLLVCLQEKDGKLGPRVSESLKKSTPPNIYLTCSKSGKLDKKIMKDWVSNCLCPVMASDPGILLLDSWSGQLDNDLFVAVPNCKRLQIPPKTTSFIQPLDRYFFRQYKILAKRISERVFLDDLQVDLKERANVIKMHSLIFNQMQSQKFTPLLKYAWYASGYTETRAGGFLNLEEILFAFDPDECEEDMCERQTFIKCSHCEAHLCFEHFFVENHAHFDWTISNKPEVA